MGKPPCRQPSSCNACRKVLEAKLEKGAKGLEPCVLKELKGLRFGAPKGGGKSALTIPFVPR